MYSSTILAAAATLLALTHAAPTPQTTPTNDGQCMTIDEAQQVANNFKDLIAAYSDDLANQVLSPSFVDYSSSVNSIINSGGESPNPLLQPAFNTLAAFEDGQGHQPPIPFAQLNLWYTCDGTVIMRWQSDDPAHGHNDVAQQPVVGNVVMETQFNPQSTCATDKFVITTTYSEFNSAAWLVDLGVFTPGTPASSKLKARMM